jgi:hypothetical protein
VRWALVLCVVAACAEPRGPLVAYDRAAEPFRQLDVLLVIDDTGSMTSEHDRIVAGVPALTAALEQLGADLHIGVVTPTWGRSASTSAIRRARGTTTVAW